MKDLQRMLSDGVRYNPTYQPSGNSDHLPMTLCAIAGLGGDIDFSQRYRADYQKILHEVSPQPALTQWQDGLGRGDFMYPATLAWCQAQVEIIGADALIRQLLPELISSLGLAAFHPLIRLGYAIEFECDAEVAAALAYWITVHEAAPTEPELVIELRGELARQQANMVDGVPTPFRATGFSGRMLEQIREGNYPLGRASNLADCANIALDLYMGTRNFFALHLVTASLAMRHCLPYLLPDPALAALTGSFLAAHRALDCPDVQPNMPAPVPANIDREHAYKYAWACFSEYQHYGDQRYLQELRDWKAAALLPAWCAQALVLA